METLGVYAHVPFCRSKCGYCDFSSYAGMESFYAPYVAALRGEIRAQSIVWAGRVIADTFYIGGGTPTVLPEGELVSIVETLRDSFAAPPSAEFTVEANPGTVSAELLRALAHAGVNRLSFGVQSFSDDLLRSAGRIHTAADAERGMKMALEAGFDNVSVDLMYGLPRQTLADLERSIMRAVECGAAHISVYGLKVEEGTAFDDLQKRGALALPNEDEEEAMYEFMTRALPKLGFRRYEISNFARPGRESCHNLKYWRAEPYLGLGAAAYSCYNGVRRAHTSDVNAYISCSESGSSASDVLESLDADILMEEFCFLGLRLSEGISVAKFEKRFGKRFAEVYGATVKSLTEKGLVAADETAIRLTERGMKYGNQAFCEFLLK